MIRRLRGHAAFRQVRQEGTRVRTAGLWCTMYIDPTMTDTEVGYAIGRQVGPAVVRNRIRRRLRALVTVRAADLPPGRALIGVQPEAAQWTSAHLAGALDLLLSRLRSEATS